MPFAQLAGLETGVLLRGGAFAGGPVKRVLSLNPEPGEVSCAQIHIEDVYPIEPTDPIEPKARGGGVVVSNPVDVLVSSVCYLG